MIRLASLEMHPLDTDDRIPEIKNEFGSGMCNITRCCTEVCPEHINITDNGIIPLKERVVDRYYDPVAMLAAQARRQIGAHEDLGRGTRSGAFGRVARAGFAALSCAARSSRAHAIKNSALFVRTERDIMLG